MSVFLLILVIVLYAGAVFVASDRRAALRNVGMAIVTAVCCCSWRAGSASST